MWRIYVKPHRKAKRDRKERAREAALGYNVWLRGVSFTVYRVNIGLMR